MTELRTQLCSVLTSVAMITR